MACATSVLPGSLAPGWGRSLILGFALKLLLELQADTVGVPGETIFEKVLPHRMPVTTLSPHFTLIRYDQRGNGMSDWNDVDIHFERMVDDLEAVIDSYDYDNVAIFGPSQAAAVSVAYAKRYPKRVSRLVLYGSYARGRRRRGSVESVAESEALVTLIRQSWANENPAIRQAYTSLMMPDATRAEAEWFNEFQKTCGPAENIARFREMFDDIDIVDLLGDITAPTLVAHSTGDSVAPLTEGKLVASRIPGARFVTFNSRNHMMFEHEPDFPRFVSCAVEFLGAGSGPENPQTTTA